MNHEAQQDHGVQVHYYAGMKITMFLFEMSYKVKIKPEK